MILHLYNSGHRDSDAEIQCICSIKSACTPTFEKISWWNYQLLSIITKTKKREEIISNVKFSKFFLEKVYVWSYIKLKVACRNCPQLTTGEFYVRFCKILFTNKPLNSTHGFRNSGYGKL